MSLGTLLFAMVALMAFVIFCVVAVFVAVGAKKFLKSKEIDITDGLDENELRIIRDQFAKRKAATAEAELKAKLADIAKP